MRAIKSLVVAALVATGVAIAADAQAATNPIARSSGWSGPRGGGGHWSGGGHFGGGHFSGGHFSGGHFHGHFGHGRFFGPRFGVFIGAPIFWPGWYGGYPYYWGYPYYYDWYYPRAAYVESYPVSTPDEAATTEVPVTPGAPTQAPAYMNYCESARAYYPKVTSCPEGWKFQPARPRY